MHKIEFINSDATPKIASVIASRDSIPLIMQWYGAFYAGDRYRVTIDGVKVDKDHNGELVGGF